MSEAVLTFADLQIAKALALLARDDLAHDQRGSLPEAVPESRAACGTYGSKAPSISSWPSARMSRKQNAFSDRCRRLAANARGRPQRRDRTPQPLTTSKFKLANERLERDEEPVELPNPLLPGTRSTEARWTRWQCPQGANKLATSLRFNPVWATASIKRLLPNETHVGATAARPEQDDLVRLRLAALHAGGADRHAGHGKAGRVRLVGKKTLERGGRNMSFDHIARDFRRVAGREIVGNAEPVSSPHRGPWFPRPWSEIRLSAGAAPSPEQQPQFGSR